MRNIIVGIFIFLAGSSLAIAQCGKDVVLTSIKTEYLDASGVLKRSDDERSTIDISKSQIVIVPGNDQRKITGTITSDSCGWKTPFKEGKSVIKTTLVREGEEPLDGTITIEGKEGKITLLVEIHQMPDQKIRAIIDKFEEKK